MVRLWLRLISVLTIFCIVPVALIPTLSYDDRDLNAFLTVTTDCILPCFIGVLPGVTLAGDALELLRQHEWIRDARMNASGQGYGDIRWDWSGAQPNLIDTNLRPEESLIETISFYTHARIFDAQTWYGDPNASSVTMRADNLLGYAAAYYGQASMLHVSTSLPCPLNLMAYWEARAKITMTIGYITSQPVPLAALMDTC